ncbi:ABC transporter permease [Pseudoroseicyclus aestuarii]
MLLTALCLTLVVFFLTNLAPSLERVAKTQIGARVSDAEVESWLNRNGYGGPMLARYGEWLGVMPGWTSAAEDGGLAAGRCLGDTAAEAGAPRYCGVLQGDWGTSTVFRDEVATIIARSLALTGKLMLWVLVVMVPGALVIGVLSGMREGSRTDRGLSTLSILSTATPEYVSGVVFIAVFASSAVGLRWFNGSATSAMEQATFTNFTLPVMTIALYGMGYIARMTRASMAEVMTSQYIRTARLKGVSFRALVLRHALRNALIAPFTVIMLQIPWILNGVVIVETLFNYKGFGWTLVQAASNNDIELLLGVSVVSVIVVLLTQLISDLGYVYLNPRIRIS